MIASNLLLVGIWLIAALGSCGWGLYQLARYSGEFDTGGAQKSSV